MNFINFTELDKGGRYDAYSPKVDDSPFFWNPSLRGDGSEGSALVTHSQENHKDFEMLPN